MRDTRRDVAPGAGPPAGRRWPFWLAVAALFAAVLVACALLLDRPAGAMHSEWPRKLWLVAEFTTHLGEAHWVIAPTAIVVLAAFIRHFLATQGVTWSPSRLVRNCGFLLAASISALLLATVLKALVGRARPQLMDTVGAFAWKPVTSEVLYLSFPSGHAANVGATCMAVALLWPAARLPALAVALWLAATRVFVGAHYPSDVVAGLMLGAGVTLALSAVAERRGWLSFPRRAAGAPALSVSAPAQP